MLRGLHVTKMIGMIIMENGKRESVACLGELGHVHMDRAHGALLLALTRVRVSSPEHPDSAQCLARIGRVVWERKSLFPASGGEGSLTRRIASLKSFSSNTPLWSLYSVVTSDIFPCDRRSRTQLFGLAGSRGYQRQT